jgi:hypothetical protein
VEETKMASWLANFASQLAIFGKGVLKIRDYI